MRVIEELYYGNIPLSERDFKHGSEYAHVLQLATRHEEALHNTLTEAQNETFGTYKECIAELEGMAEIATFSLWFKLGLRLTAEAFLSDNPDHIGE